MEWKVIEGECLVHVPGFAINIISCVFFTAIQVMNIVIFSSNGENTEHIMKYLTHDLKWNQMMAGMETWILQLYKHVTLQMEQQPAYSEA